MQDRYLASKKDQYIANIKQFLSFLHNKLQIPAKEINQCLRAEADTLNGYSIPLNVLTVAKGWPNEQPKLVLPVMYAGYGSMLIGLVKGIADMAKMRRFEHARKDYQAVIAGTAAFMFTLRTIIAAYVFVASDFGKNESEVDASLNVFLTMVGASAALGLVNTTYNITNAHSPIKNKGLKFLGGAANALTASTHVHNFISEVDTNLNLGLKDSTDPTAQLIIYGVSLAAGSMVAGVAQRSPTTAQSFIAYLSAFNILNLLIQSYNQLIAETANEATETDKSILLSLWLTALVVPLITKAAMVYYNRYQQRQDEYQKLATDEIFHEEGIQAKELSGPGEFGIFSTDIESQSAAQDEHAKDVIVPSKTPPIA